MAELCARLRRAEDRTYAQIPPSSDPFHAYLEAQYRRIVSLLQQTVISMIDLSASDTPNAVNVPPRSYDMLDLFFTAHGLEEQPKEEISFIRFAKAFENYRGRVLLLGEPGAGKTITLMAHARDATAARLDDPTKPLPLLGLVATWDSQKQPPLADWLTIGHDDLAAEIRRTIADGHALLVLDGLDELGSEREEPDPNDPQKKVRYDPRPRFMCAIPSNNQVVVTCRAADYEAIGEQVMLNGAVTLQPLSATQMCDYLLEVPDLWIAIENDAELKKLLETPLVLSLFAFAYRDHEEEAAKLQNLRNSPGDLRGAILSKFVQRCYEHEERKPTSKIVFTLEEVYDVLGQLAMVNAAVPIQVSLFPSRFSGFLVENVLELADIEIIIGKEKSIDFIAFVTQLNLIIPSEHGTFRFRHSLFRDFFAFTYSVSHAQDIDWYSADRFESDWQNPVNALGRLADSRAIHLLIQSLGSDSSVIRTAAAKALGLFRDQGVIEPLIAAFDDASEIVRENVIIALGELDDIRAIETLLLALKDRNGSVRAAAACALGNLQEDVRLSRQFREDFFATLSKLKEGGIPFHLYQDGHFIRLSFNRTEMTILELDPNTESPHIDTRAVRPLIDALKDDEKTVRENVIAALGKLGDCDATEPLIEILSNEWDDELHGLVIESLGMLRDPDAIPMLDAILEDEDKWSLHDSVIDALEEIGTPEALSAVEAWRRRQDEA